MIKEEIIINSKTQNYELEIFHLARLFFAGQSLQVNHNQTQSNNQVVDTITIIKDNKENTYTYNKELKQVNALVKDRLLKRYMKQATYSAFVKLTGKTMPWGCLTGVRPTSIAYQLLEEGVDIVLLKEVLVKEFYISPIKAKLLVQVVKNQKGIIRNDHLVDLYINIPICPSRCSYCSFISAEYKSVEKLVPAYIEALIKEINATKQLINKKALVVNNIYIGGGTPSVLSAEQLDKVLNEISYPVNEFTVECGRADTITDEKLAVLKKHGVTRVSINPQTFTVKTLKKIGRGVTNNQVFAAYMNALKYDFVVNMDLIAGLEGESLINFKKSIKTVLELNPHNITVHTLFMKKNSSSGVDDKNLSDNSGLVSKMVNHAYENLDAKGYKPYYLYRQKNQIEALENVGYSLPGHNCLFNIDSMEEITSIIACGANAISKKLNGNDAKVQRHQNYKFIDDYIKNIDNVIISKNELFS